jgi:magnesium transporter
MKKEKKSCVFPNHEFPPDSAGRSMTTCVPTISPESTIKTLEEKLHKHMVDYETINYTYVVDQHNHLIGIVSIKEIFRQPKSKKIEAIMKDSVVSVRAHTDQERVSYLAMKNNLKAMPVVDKDNHFLGIVPADIIQSILYSEAEEDLMKSAGITPFGSEGIKAGTWIHIKKRLPWLVLGLIGGMVAAFVIGRFEHALEQEILLAAFIPAIVYMADAVGSQSQTIFIRSMALDRKINILSYFFHELKVSIAMSVILGILVSLIACFWQGSFVIGVILALSMFITIIVASVIAIIMPWLFERLKYDPAVASGPFATIIRDLLSIIIYFLIATSVLSYYS